VSEEVSGSPKRPLRPWIIKMAWLGVPLVLLGEAGHLLLTSFRQTLAHHFFHLVFGVGAGVVFLIYVIQDVRHNGWPGFSWHLHPRPPRPPETPA
jgi:hypothetical protein